MIALLLAGAVAIVVSLVGTPVLMRWLQANGIGQPIREDGPQGHFVKAGTPTMGGVAIIGGAVAGYLVGHAQGQIFTWGGLAAMLCAVLCAAIGFGDDWRKVRQERSAGLSRKARIGGELAAAGIFCVIAVRYAHVKTTLSFPRWDALTTTPLPTWLWVIWAVLLIIGTCNAVNLSDGIDGLAAGSASFALSAFAVIGFWQFRHFDIYAVPQALDTALVAVALTGGCVGFLWWNAPPARIFMGDTGALGIGGGIAALALVMNLHLLLPIIAGLFVLITMSDIIQIVSFRLFHTRVFRMAPLHHHFELLGWPETTVLIRFWILAGLCTAMALGIFYADFIALGAAD